MSTPIRIRPAERRDRAACQAIHARATMSSYGAIYTWLEPILSDPGTPLEPCDWSLVAELDDVVVGYVAVTGRHIENLYVAPEAQGRALGQALLHAAEERIGGPSTLRCLTVNERARRLYERCGYTVLREETSSYHGRSLQAWFMGRAEPAR